jgi:hypothetical protein
MRPWFAVITGLGLGCSSGLRHPSYAPQPTSALFEVTAPPPPGRVESIPPAPIREAVWIDGEWRWRRHKWGWEPGYWAVPPPHAKFSPWAFVRDPDGRFWVAPGSWRDSSGAAIPPPPQLSLAHLDPAEVVNAVGSVENTASTETAKAPVPAK